MKTQSGRSREMSNETDEIDNVLGRTDEILPSSGFAASVMDAVRREAAAPPPIPFPWARAIPGIAVAALVLLAILAWGIAAAGHLDSATVSQPSISFRPSPMGGGLGGAMSWIMLSLAGAYVTVKLTMRITSSQA